MKSSFTGRVILIYGGLLLVVISMTFLFSYMGTVRGLRSQLKETNFALLNQINQKLELSFKQTEKDLLQLTNELEFVYFMNNVYKDDAQRYANFYGLDSKLGTFMNRNLQFSSIYVYSHVSGDILTQQNYISNDGTEDQWLTQYLNMDGYFKWSPTHQISDGMALEDVVTLIRSYPALSKPGFRTGLLAVNMKESVLYQMIQDIYQDGNKGQTFVIDQQGQVVTHNDKSKLHSSLKDMPYLENVLIGPDAGSFSIKPEQEKQMVFYTTSTYTGWKIVSIVPEDQMYRPLTVTRNLLLAFSVLMFAIALIILFYVSRRTFRPMDALIGKLSGKYRPVQAGRFDGTPHKGLSYLDDVIEQMFLDREGLEQQVRDAKPMLKWRTVMDILTGYRTVYSTVIPHLEFTGVRLYPEWFVVCTAEFGKEGGISPRDEILYAYALCNVAEEIIYRENAGVAIDLGGCRVVILLSFSEGDEAQNHLRAATLLEHILDVMSKQIGLVVTAGVGRCYRELGNVPRSYEESKVALRYKMVTGPQTVISIEDLQPLQSQDYYQFPQRIDRILEALKQADRDKLQMLVQDVFMSAVKNNAPPELFKQLSFELVMRAMQMIDSIGIDVNEIQAEIGTAHEVIQKSDNWRQTEELVSTLLLRLLGAIEEKRMQRGKNDTIDQILIYIRQHYQDSDLSLDKLADEFHLNPAYISRQFKEHAEGNFIDYLIEIRINAAKELLKDKTVRIYDVSEAVGYTNSRSFMRSFKKYTGLTPTEYRERFL